MRRTKIKIDKPIIFIDTSDDKIVWFEKISDNRIIGWSYNQSDHELEHGSWSKEEWEEFIKKEKMDRFIKLGDTNITSNILQGIIIKLFRGDE